MDYDSSAGRQWSIQQCQQRQDRPSSDSQLRTPKTDRHILPSPHIGASDTGSLPYQASNSPSRRDLGRLSQSESFVPSYPTSPNLPPPYFSQSTGNIIQSAQRSTISRCSPAHQDAFSHQGDGSYNYSGQASPMYRASPGTVDAFQFPQLSPMHAQSVYNHAPPSAVLNVRRAAGYDSPASHNPQFYNTESISRRPPAAQTTPGLGFDTPLTSQGTRSPKRPSTHAIEPPQRFRRVRARTDLVPKRHETPKFRRANPDGGFISPLQAMTMHLNSTFAICNPNFVYDISKNPRRVLTKPSKGVKNDGYDNEDSDYILYVNDTLGNGEGHKYLILDVLGQGTFGQVVKCQNLKSREVVAIKVVKNKPAYLNQSRMEVNILHLLNQQLDKHDEHHILRMKDDFMHRNHLCLVFELLSVNLYELIKQNHFRGLSTNLVRVFTAQLLDALTVLNEAKLIHCDLKPENILLKKHIYFIYSTDPQAWTVRLLKSLISDPRVMSKRYPEVLLGIQYNSSIDMWSLGCIVCELFLGLPLFPGSSEYNQVSRMVEMLGTPPTWMLEKGKQGAEYFDKTTDEFGGPRYRLKTMEQYSREHNTSEQPSKKYFSATTLPEIIKTYPLQRKGLSQAEIDKEKANRLCFIDFAQGLLNPNPWERWTPQQAKLHPFVRGEPLAVPFVPPAAQLVRQPRLPHSTSSSISRQTASHSSHTMSPPHTSAYPPTYNGAPIHPYGPTLYSPPRPPAISSQYLPSQPYHSSHQSHLAPLYSSRPTATGPRPRANTQIGPIPSQIAAHLMAPEQRNAQPSPAAYYPSPENMLSNMDFNGQHHVRGRSSTRILEEGTLPF
ncbi:Serine/threonine-protein kinase ppk15 [Neolecta irregularis DAH-3]|uniref:Serine/threonine-protein kinase ppk15 n=1 Tax=Neolecta irregularis (strain DAH-3) TaxID=1198029 RepID=A0A1U7LG86_NEOID|nr:Serine/threonine-protein kinase ppk15 [Neolecta irregularis DAH-3]|eukprot:OLL21638.1 Serine/threonine-protein kinase ppk15 [Neolecta irregularis DAH-3]